MSIRTGKRRNESKKTTKNPKKQKAPMAMSTIMKKVAGEKRFQRRVF